jgi:predicted TIM-barrel fold metal-dependent hydrolase
VPDIDNLVSGRLLGIKIYPPIGFNPCPATLPQTYSDFYTWCCANDIPLTVHCQTGSYSAGKEGSKVAENTNPINWRNLLQQPQFNTLRINFAHFGGETGTEEMFQRRDYNTNSWTYTIIELLKNYPNTYADLSAYDYSSGKHRKNLRTIFELDVAGAFGPGHALADKLLWGSDVPMVISDKSYRRNHKSDGISEYTAYLKGFTDTINSSTVLSEIDKSTIINKLTEVNPKRFLRIP